MKTITTIDMRRTVFTITLVLLTVVGVCAQRFQSAGLYFNVTYNEVEYSVTGIGEYAFRKCSALTQVTLPNSVTSIGESAFRECSALAQVNIPGSVTDIGNWAFNECAALTHITIPDGVAAIGYGTFQNCSALAQVNIGSGVGTIGEYAFYICSSLAEVTIPDNVTSIESNAFKSCSSLREVTIGNGLAGMGDSAFANCKSLTCFNVASGNTAFCAEDGVLFSKDKSTLVQYPAGKAETTYAIPGGVTRLGTEAFYGCSSLLTLHCGTATPPALGSNCFKSSGITTVFIPAGTLEAYTSAWGNGYTYIEEWELTVHVETPGGLEAALNGHNSSKITRLTITGTLNGTDFSLINNDMTRLYALDISGITNTTLPDEVFAVNTTLLQVDLPSQLTAIPVWAFLRCSIPAISIPESVTSIGKEAFYKCTALTQVTIPEGVTSMGSRAFANCTALTRVNWNAIRCGDFVYDSSTMTYPPFNNSPVSEFTWGDKGQRVHLGRQGGTYSRLQLLRHGQAHASDPARGRDRHGRHGLCPLHGTHAGELERHTLQGLCKQQLRVSEFTWGDKVEHIPAYSCYGMDKLTQVTLPEGVAGLGDMAFANCTSLAKMTVLPTTPPAVTGNTFDGVTRDIPVLVPAASLTAYKAAEVWKEFIKLQAIGTTGLHVPFLPENIRMEGGMLHNPQQLHLTLYDMQGRQVYSGTAATISQPAGVYVLRCNGASGKAVF